MLLALPGGTYKQGMLVALDGYIIPIRIGVYLLDTCNHPAVSPLALCCGWDALSGTISFSGGNIDPGETIMEAAVGEDGEECGTHRKPALVHPHLLAFFTRGWVRNRAAPTYDTCTRRPTVGVEYKLRIVCRTQTWEFPKEQSGKHGPELLRPRYTHIMPEDTYNRNFRPTFAHAIRLADSLGMLRLPQRLPAVEADYVHLRKTLTQLRIHPAIIDFYCKPQPKGIRLSWQEKLNILPPAVIGHLQNLDLADQQQREAMQNLPPEQIEAIMAGHQ